MKRIFRRSLLLTALAGIVAYFYLTLPDVAVLRKTNPQSSALMRLRDAEYGQNRMRIARRHFWVPYGMISQHLKQAVLLGEDASFFSHSGVDAFELKEALRKDLETVSFKRGGSTITMQLAKNLYLSPSKNPLRKVKEILIAWQLEHELTKRRIFEIYLNIVEWGPHVYGAEAASRYYFDKPAASLEVLEAATLAALLPSPRNLRETALIRRRNLILQRLNTTGYVDAEEYARLIDVPLSEKFAR